MWIIKVNSAITLRSDFCLAEDIHLLYIKGGNRLGKQRPRTPQDCGSDFCSGKHKSTNTFSSENAKI